MPRTIAVCAMLVGRARTIGAQCCHGLHLAEGHTLSRQILAEQFTVHLQTALTQSDLYRLGVNGLKCERARGAEGRTLYISTLRYNATFSGALSMRAIAAWSSDCPIVLAFCVTADGEGRVIDRVTFSSIWRSISAASKT